MGDKRHFTLSAIKSILRIMGCILLMLAYDAAWVTGFAACFGIAEIFGLLEEVFDRR